MQDGKFFLFVFVLPEISCTLMNMWTKLHHDGRVKKLHHVEGMKTKVRGSMKLYSVHEMKWLDKNITATSDMMGSVSVEGDDFRLFIVKLVNPPWQHVWFFLCFNDVAVGKCFIFPDEHVASQEDNFVDWGYYSHWSRDALKTDRYKPFWSSFQLSVKAKTAEILLSCSKSWRFSRILSFHDHIGKGTQKIVIQSSSCSKTKRWKTWATYVCTA